MKLQLTRKALVLGFRSIMQFFVHVRCFFVAVLLPIAARQNKIPLLMRNACKGVSSGESRLLLLAPAAKLVVVCYLVRTSAICSEKKNTHRISLHKTNKLLSLCPTDDVKTGSVDIGNFILCKSPVEHHRAVGQLQCIETHGLVGLWKVEREEKSTWNSLEYLALFFSIFIECHHILVVSKLGKNTWIFLFSTCPQVTPHQILFCQGKECSETISRYFEHMQQLLHTTKCSNSLGELHNQTYAEFCISIDRSGVCNKSMHVQLCLNNSLTQTGAYLVILLAWIFPGSCMSKKPTTGTSKQKCRSNKNRNKNNIKKRAKQQNSK